MRSAMIAALALMASSTAALAAQGREPFQEIVDSMDLERFLGSWYVVGVMPTIFERGATNGIETYSLDAEGSIRVEYVFYKGSPKGKKTVMRQKGWVVNKGRNTEWRVQPLWPLKLPYLIIDLAEDYRYAVVGTNNYDNVWIMSRTPAISEEDYRGILDRLAKRGYKIERIERMQQAW